MNGFELCENSDQQKLPPELMRSEKRNTNLSKLGEDSVSKKAVRR